MSLIPSLMQAMSKAASSDVLPPPSTERPPRPPHSAGYPAHLEACDTFQTLLNETFSTLEGTLTDTQRAYVERLIQLSSDVAVTKLLAGQSRTAQTRTHEMADHKIAHTQMRMRTRPGIGLNVDRPTLKRLAREWQQCPGERLDPHTMIRQVHYRGKRFYAIYDVHGTGAQYLSTVLEHNPGTRDYPEKHATD
ncbi:hypothetical protein [Deinococcus ficus]|uniref:Uncharacterized protein n=1 Tax=Deinococcus ficus TaxID=317577 RepID=A0A221T2V7_9DEIO|nr:hypothetical protein [Deinococcus ficus]ASN83234.1 hypothetical protein DFI_18730 [Deinococcus ficus]